MKINVSEATGKVLDLLVAKSEGIPLRMPVRATNQDVENLTCPFVLYDVDVFCSDNDDPVSAHVKTIKVVRYGIDTLAGATAPSIDFIEHDGRKARGSVNMFYFDKDESELAAVVAVKGVVRLFSFSADWSQAGPIIEREFIELRVVSAGTSKHSTTDSWEAIASTGSGDDLFVPGPTPIIAAMRCYATSKLGSEVEIPDELLS